MNINIVSSLSNRAQRGGAYLRFKTIERIYDWLGLNSNTVYQDEILKRNSYLSYLRSLYYGKNSKTMFQKAKLDLPQRQYLHLESLRYFCWDISSRRQAKLIYNAHNLECESLFLRENKRSRDRFIRYEVSQMKKCDVVFVCSSREKEVVVDHCPELEDKVFVLPNLVDVDDYYTCEDKKIISFIGTLDYFPNQQAIDYLCNDFIRTVPLDIKQEYRFVIAGRSPVEGQAELCRDSGFEFITDLTDDEMRELHAQTRVSLVPLQHGSGTRLKIVEALCSGAQVLSTELGAEGLDDPLITKAGMEDFAEQFVELINSDMPDCDRERLYRHDLRSWYMANRECLIKKLGII